MKKNNSKNIFSSEISYPSQLDVCFGEKCNLDCDYCFVKKTSKKVLNIKTIKNAVYTFFKLPGKNKTITFTTSEPFLYPDLFKNSVIYANLEAQKYKINLNIIATTNGILFNDKMQKFISDLGENFTLNFSIDGSKESHNAHRKIKGKSTKTSFDLAWENIAKFKRKKGIMRVILTVTTSELLVLRKNLDFLKNNSFSHVDIFPQMFYLWKDDDIKILKEIIKEIIRDNNKTGKIDIRILNRLWGASRYSKILLGSDGNFYAFEWVLPLKESQRKSFIIGSSKNINIEKRKNILELLFEKTAKTINYRCNFCEYKSFCSNPLPLYLWSIYNKKNFTEYFNSFCNLAKVMIGVSKEIKNKNDVDGEKWKKYERERK